MILELLKGFCQVKKIQKSEKNSEVGGWFNPQLGLILFFVEILCFCVFYVLFSCFQKKLKIG